jgi:xanthine dehydrogenase accessory factor
VISGELSDRAERLRSDRVPFVVATVVRAQRPTSARVGDTAVILEDSTIEGFVGGICAQATIRLYAAEALARGEPLVLRIVPAGGEGGDATDGLGETIVAHNPCLSGGMIELLLEPQLPAPRMVVVGDAPIARALEGLAREAGYDVLRTDSPAIGPDSDAAAVIVASHGENEEPVLTSALNAGIGYVALVCSEVRGAAVRDSLELPAELRQRLHAPAGLRIGAQSSAEVAVAILAEIVAERSSQPAAGSELGGVTAPAALARPATAVDPICGMEVVASDATLHVDLDGERVYFCREQCRTTYLEGRAADAAARK